MANSLQAVMKLTDEYTATMQKIIQSTDAYEKRQKEIDRATNTLQNGIRNIGVNSSSAVNGISAIAFKIGGLVTAATLAKKAVGVLFDAIKTGANQQVQLNTFQALMGNKALGSDLYNYVSSYAQKSALGRGDLASATTSFLAYTKDINQLQQLLNLVQRLYMFNPEQGAEGAVFALKEVLSGQTMSLRNRFNMNGISADKIEKNYEKGDIAGTIKYLDQVFNNFGATQGVVDANFNSLMVQSQKFATNFQQEMGSQANPSVQSLTQTLVNLNAQMDSGKFQGFFNAVANGASNLAIAGAWLAENFQTVVPTVSAVIGAFAAYKIACEAIQMTSAITGIVVNSVAGNWIGLAAAIAGAAGAGILASQIIGAAGDGGATKQFASAQDAMRKLQEDQKKFGASTKGNAVVNANVTNSNPIKVSGTVEIEKENLKYVFEASTAKFFAQFNATRIEPSVNIQEQHIHQEADLETIDYALGGIVKEHSAVGAGGIYK